MGAGSPSEEHLDQATHDSTSSGIDEFTHEGAIPLDDDIIELAEQSKNLLRVLRRSIRSSIALSSRRPDWDVRDLGGHVAAFGETLEWRNEELDWELGLLRTQATDALEAQLAVLNSPYVVFANALLTVTEHINIQASTAWRTRKLAQEKIDVICELHAQAITVTEEVLALLKAGFPTGASARWRTLYELCIVANFLARAPKDTVRRYKASHIMEYWRENELALEEIPRKNKSTRARLLAQREILRPERDNLLAKYGKEFDSQYGWAAVRLGKRKVTFKDIERRVRGRGDRVLPAGDRLSYKAASQHIHGERTSSMGTLALVPKTRSLFVGATLWPAHIQIATIWTLQSVTWTLAELTTRTQHVAEALYWGYVAYMYALDADTESWQREHSIDTGYLRKRFGLDDGAQWKFF